MTLLEITRERGHALLEQMLLIRRFEEACAELYVQQKIRGFLHLYIGEEAVAVGAIHALREDDNLVATYREHGHALVRGISPGAVMAEMFGKQDGCARGRGGSMHLFCTEKRFFGGHAIVGGGLPVAVGLAMADRVQQSSRVTACFVGDGATNEGEFPESLNLAALWELPVLFICENNLYAMGTALERHMAELDIAGKAEAYGVTSEVVDGMDVLAVERAVRYAADTIRDTGKPRFLELRTYRFRAHSMYDAERYRDKAEVARWKERDPLDRFAKRLLEAGLLEDRDLERMERQVAQTIDKAIAFAEASPFEAVEDLTKDVYVREVR